jgi:hypothetical protein
MAGRVSPSTFDVDRDAKDVDAELRRHDELGRRV